MNAPPGPARPQWRTDALRVLVVFLAFGLVATITWESFGPGGGPSFFFPSAGVTVAALLLNRRALWPAIVVAVVLAELLVDTGYRNPLWVAAGFAASNVVEALVGSALVLAWCRGRPDLRERRDFALFLVGACLIGPFFGALIGGTVSSVKDGTPWPGAMTSWWASDALGVLVMASVILLWTVQSHLLRARRWEAAAVLLLTGLLSVGAFWTVIPLPILILPVLAWAALRLDMLGAAMAGAALAFLVNFVAASGRGLFADTDLPPGTQVALTQVYVAVIVVVAMLIAQEASGRRTAVRERESERRERIRLESLSRLGLQLSAALTAKDIGRALAAQLLNEAGAQALTLGLLSPDGRRLECVDMAGFPAAVVDRYAATGMPMSEHAVATDVVRSGNPVEFHSFDAYRRVYPDTGLVAGSEGAQAIVGWPLSYGGEAFGVLVLLWPGPEPLGAAQRSYISAVATMVSQALVRAKIYDDEHARAAVLHSLAQPEVPVDTVGLRYRALYQPADDAHGLGGDWYSVLALPDRRTYLAVGDVIGHGLASVEDMARLRATGDAYAHQGLSPAQLLDELNRFASQQIQGEFATNTVAVFDPADFSLTYSSAGHLPTLLRRARTGEVIRLSDASGPLLGPFEDSCYEQRTVLVESDDVMVMYTDGLVEHHGGGLTAGIDNLQHVVAAWSPEALLDCAALAGVVASAPSPDDICLLVVKFGGDGLN